MDVETGEVGTNTVLIQIEIASQDWRVKPSTGRKLRFHTVYQSIDGVDSGLRSVWRSVPTQVNVVEMDESSRLFYEIEAAESSVERTSSVAGLALNKGQAAWRLATTLVRLR